jgi:hypothetical protein
MLLTKVSSGQVHTPCDLNCNIPLRESFGIYLLSLQRMDKIMETAEKDTHFFINTELDHHLPVIQLVSFLE